MTPSPRKTAKSAGRTIALALLGVLTLTGIAAVAAPNKPDFSMAPTPSTQTVSKPAAGTATVDYTIQIARLNGFSGSVALSHGSLPAGVSVTFTPATIPSSTASTTNSSQMRVTYSSTTPIGNHTIFVIGKSGSLTKYTAVTLNVQSSQPDFALNITPSMQYIAGDDVAVYTIKLERLNGFTGNVALSLYNQPPKTGATLSTTSLSNGLQTEEATLTMTSEHHVQEGSFSFAVLGTASVDSQSVTRFGAMGINIENTKEIGLRGDLTGTLGPNVTRFVDVEITNPHQFAVRLRDLALHIEETTSRRGCSADQNFITHQISKQRLAAGIWIPAKSSKRLSELNVAEGDRPAIEMRNLDDNQDVCKGAQLTLQYTGTAGK